MLNNPTATKLHKMQLHLIAEGLENPEPELADLSFDERLAILVEREWFAKLNRKVATLIRNAKFTQSACLEDIRWQGRNPECKQTINALKGTIYMEKKLNLLISGKTGSGKTFIASALGNSACRHHKKCRYYRTPELLLDLEIARADNTYFKKIESLKRHDLLILDDFGLKSFSISESNDLLEIFESRYGLVSTIIVGQVPPANWYELFSDATTADAIMDRIIHNAYLLDLQTKESMRKIIANETKKAASEEIGLKVK